MNCSADQPRSMRDPAVRERRRAMLHLPHVVPLTEFATRLRTRGDTGGLYEVPEFDPLDGGIEAEVLFLFEKPGPMTASGAVRRRIGSGFISRDNDDGTAEATFRFMQAANLARERTVTWNVVPGWNGTTKVTIDELRAGIGCVRELIGLLPALRAAVFVGNKAACARPLLADTEIALFTSAHPSPRVRASFPDRWHRIAGNWRAVRVFLDGC